MVDEILYQRREFLSETRLDGVRAELEGETYDDGSVKGRIHYDAMIQFIAEGDGSFGFYHHSPAALRPYATKIIDVLQGLVDAIDALPKAEPG